MSKNAKSQALPVQTRSPQGKLPVHRFGNTLCVKVKWRHGECYPWSPDVVHEKTVCQNHFKMSPVRSVSFSLSVISTGFTGKLLFAIATNKKFNYFGE